MTEAEIFRRIYDIVDHTTTGVAHHQMRAESTYSTVLQRELLAKSRHEQAMAFIEIETLLYKELVSKGLWPEFEFGEVEAPRSTMAGATVRVRYKPGRKA